MRLLRVPVALVLTLTVPGVAFAQVPPPPKKAAKTAPEPAPEPELSEDEKEEKAKNLYLKAEGLAADGNWADAVPLYEQAYYLVPGKHGFAHKVGIATWKIDNCDKTKEYLTHFVTYAEGEKYAEKIAEAQAILDEVEERQCATATTTAPEVVATPTTDENPLDDNPLDDKTKTDSGKSKDKKGLLIGGAALMVLGLGGIGAGAAGVAMASGAGSSLSELSSNNTPTGYPTGDYACRGAGECPSDLESRLETGKLIGTLGFVAGGVLLVTGVALIAVHLAKKKKAGGGANAGLHKLNQGAVQLTGAGPMLLPGGGGGAMAGIRF